MSTRISVKTLLLIGILIGAATVTAVTFSSQDAVKVSDGVTLGAPDGANITLQGETNVSMEQPFPKSDTVRFETEAGNISFVSSGPANASIHKSNITGTYTNVTSIGAVNNNITIAPENKTNITVGQDIDRIEFRNATLDDGNIDFVYAGASGNSLVVVQGLPANDRIKAVDETHGGTLQVVETDGNGVATFDSLSNSEHAVSLESSDGNPIVSDVQPRGDLQSDPTQISAQINDSEFSGGDSVDVEIILDGSTVSTQTISSNQTVTTSMPSSGQTGGSHDINVTAVDSFGASDTQIETYNVPSTFFVRNETNHTELIPANGTITFFGSNETYDKSTDNGKFDMDGLPVNEDFVVEVTATDEANYTNRSVYVESIYEQQSAYLLNTSAYSTIESRFVLDDPTGKFDSESVLKIQRPINISGNSTFQTVHADKFGTEGVIVQLQKGQRHQLIVDNGKEEQSVGPYRADLSETVDVRPGTPSISINTEAFADGWAANATLDNVSLQYLYQDPDEKTSELIVWIHQRNNESNTLQPNVTYLDLGNASGAPTLTVNESKNEWVVNFVITRDGETFIVREIVRNNPDLTLPIDAGWQQTFGISMLILFAGAFSVLNAPVGAVIVSLVGGVLWWIGFLGSATTGAAIAIAIFISVVMYMHKGSR